MDQVGQVREKIDIVSLISEYISLQKTGQNFKAICPFHGEKTPSFVVSPIRQIWHCFGCFPKGELVKTPFGYHPIETVVENEFVVSGKGDYQKVLAIHKRNYNGDLIKVKTRKIRKQVNLTGDHHVLVVGPYARHENKFKYFSKRYRNYLSYLSSNRDYYFKKTEKYFPIREIEARKLKVGDMLLYPLNYRVSEVKTLDLNKYVTKRSHFGPKPSILPTVKVDEDFLRFIGYYIAEGSNHRAYIRFSLGNSERKFALEIVRLIKKIFKINASIHYRKSGNKTGIEITACHAYLANAIENLCGLRAQNKHIPFLFQELPPSAQRIILKAIHKGDGTTYTANKSKKIHRSITTISRILSEQIIDILLRLQFFPSLSVSKRKIDRKNVRHKEAYTVIWSEEAKPRHNLVYYTREGPKYWLLPVENVSSMFYKDEVYNLTVEEDHSYVASHFAVSNCGKGGDCYTFLMEYENMEFPESLRVLAKKAGVEIVEDQWQTISSFKKEKLYKINRLAAAFYHYILTSHSVGKKALTYLIDKRKIDAKIIETFMLGFSPSTGRALVIYLKDRKHIKTSDISEAGLGFFKNGNLVDFFQGRIIFPLFDHRDNVTGFSGRVLEDASIKSKYINTRETPVYHKGKAFFGLNVAKNEIKKEKRAIIVEGEFDVLSLFRQGIGNTVAVKGTALTNDHIRLIGRFADKVSICFDQDKPGQDAMLRSIPVLEKSGLVASVIEIPGKDPDELAKKDPALLKSAVKNDKGIYDFLIEKAIEKFDKKTYEGKKKITDQVLPFLVAIENEIIKDHYFKRLSTELSVSYESVVRQAGRIGKKDKESGMSIEKNGLRPRTEILEEYLLSIILQSGDQKNLLSSAEKILGQFKFSTPVFQGIRESLNIYFEEHSSLDINKIVQILPKEYLHAFDTCLLLSMSYLKDKHLAEAVKIAEDLREIYIKQKIKVLGEEIKSKEKEGERSETLQNQLSGLISLLQDPK